MVQQLQDASAAKCLMTCTTSNASDTLYYFMLYRPDIEKVLQALPDKATRQTLLFSATFPQDIQQLAQFAMKPGFQLIDTVGEDSTHSSSQVYCFDCFVLLNAVTHSSASRTALNSQAMVTHLPKLRAQGLLLLCMHVELIKLCCV